MLELKPITLNQYLELEDKSQYDFAMRFALIFTTPEDVFSIGDISEIKYGKIKEYQLLMNDSFTLAEQIEYLKTITTIKNFGTYKLDVFCRGVNYFNDQIKKLTERESNLLYTAPTEKEIEAGLDRFNNLGTYMQFRKLAKSFNKTIEEVKEMKYHNCFLELYTQKQEFDFQTAYSKLK